jgi:hypothetical protein
MPYLLGKIPSPPFPGRSGMKFRSDPAAIQGSIAPVVTPFTDAGAVDHDSLRGLIRFHVPRFGG